MILKCDGRVCLNQSKCISRGGGNTWSLFKKWFKCGGRWFFFF